MEKGGRGAFFSARLTYLLYAVAALIGWLLVSGGGAWTNDDGIRREQVRLINSSPERSAEVRFRFDPKETSGILPYPEEYLCRRAGKTWFIFPEIFARISAPLARPGASFRLPLLVPLIAGLLGVLFWTMAARAVQPRAGKVLPLLVLASPWMFYHWVFWEHTLALLAQAASLWLFLDSRRTWRGLAAGVLLGLGCVFRIELLPYGVALCLAWVIIREENRGPRAPQDARMRPGANLRHVGLFVLGAALPLAFFFTANLRQWGHPLGVHYLVNTEAAPTSVLHRALRSAEALLLGLSGYPAALVVALAGVVAFWAASSSHQRGRAWIGLCGAWAAALAVWATRLRAADPYAVLLQLGSLLALNPILLIGLADPSFRRGSVLRRRLALASGLTFLFIGFSAPPTAAQGIHWGPRLLLPGLVPLLILSAHRLAVLVRAGRRRHAMRPQLVALFLVLALGWLDSGRSLALLNQQTRRGAALQAFVKARSERFLASSLWWASGVYGDVRSDQSHFFVGSPDQWPSFQSFARRQGETRCLLLTDAMIPRGSRIEELQVPGAPWRGFVVDLRVYEASLIEFGGAGARRP